MSDRQGHWQKVYQDKGEADVSWFQPSAVRSLHMIARCGVAPDAPVIDVGGGASRLADGLLDTGFGDVTVLDLSDAALAQSRRRLGARAQRVRWIVADITDWRPEQRYALWHDRAVFHFLTEEDQRAAYVKALSTALDPGGWAVIATFAADGPEKCSGLPVMRYSPQVLAETLGPAFELVDWETETHRTPGGKEQRFQYSRLRRR